MKLIVKSFLGIIDKTYAELFSVLQLQTALIWDV